MLFIVHSLHFQTFKFCSSTFIISLQEEARRADQGLGEETGGSPRKALQTPAGILKSSHEDGRNQDITINAPASN